MRKPKEAQTTPRLERREFLVSTLAAGFAMIAHPIEAQMSTTHGMTVSTHETRIRAKDRKHDTSGQGSGSIMLFLCGDVMTGRGIDQILPHPGNPVLYERYMKSANGYVELAEEVNGPIPRLVDFPYIWGDALAELERRKPDVHIINLETAVTRSDEVENKAVNYRMNPDNIACITAAGIDCCALANNHVLDWGYAGLAETLKTLRMAGIRMAGAGLNVQEARVPAVSAVLGKGRVLVFSFGSETSGIPWSWAASAERPGVNLLRDFSSKTVRGIHDNIRSVKLAGDIVVASIHWGNNWGYEVPHEQQEFAYQLIDEAGVDVVYGHSSHHVKGIETYKGKLILYGCGDFMNDYEGISGHEAYRGDLSLMYFARIDSSTGNLISLHMTPMQIKKFRLSRASANDAIWLRDTLNREGKRYGTSAELNTDNSLMLRWASTN